MQNESRTIHENFALNDAAENAVHKQMSKSTSQGGAQTTVAKSLLE